MTINKKATSWAPEPVKHGETQLNGSSAELEDEFQKTMYSIKITIRGRGTMETIVNMNLESLSTCDFIPPIDTLPAKAPKVIRDKETNSFNLDGELKDSIAVCRLEKESDIPYFVELAEMSGARAIFLKDNVLLTKIQAAIPIFAIPMKNIDAMGNAASTFVKFKESYLLSELGIEVNDFANSSRSCEKNKQGGVLKMMFETEESSKPLGKGVSTDMMEKNPEEPSTVLGYSDNATKARFTFDIVLNCFGQHSTEPRILDFTRDCFDGEFLVGATIEVTYPIIYRNGEEKLNSIVGSMKDKIVVCDLKMSFEIDQYVEMACIFDAKAVFLTGGTSLSKFSIPVFVVPSIVKEYVQNTKSTLSYFELARTSAPPESTTENSKLFTDILSSPSIASSNIYKGHIEHNCSVRQERSYADALGKESICDGFDTPVSRTVNSTASTMDISTEMEFQNDAHFDSFLDNNLSDDGVQEPDRKGFISGAMTAVKAVASAVTSLFTSQSDLVKHLFRFVEWDKKSYLDAVGVLDKSVHDKDMSTITLLIDAMIKGLGKPSNNPFLVAFAAYTHNTLTEYSLMPLHDQSRVVDAILCGLKYSLSEAKLSTFGSLHLSKVIPKKQPHNSVTTFFLGCFSTDQSILSSDDNFVSIFCIWKALGLFKCNNNGTWRKIRNKIDSGFCDRNKNDLAKGLDLAELDLLSLLTQHSMLEFYEMVCFLRKLRFDSTSSSLRLQPFIADVVIDLINGSLEPLYLLTDTTGKRTECLASTWVDVVATLGVVDFSPSVYSKSYLNDGKVLRSVISHIAFVKTLTLKWYSTFLDFVAKDHGTRDVIVTELSKQLMLDLESRTGPDLSEIGGLLESSALVLLVSTNKLARFEETTFKAFSVSGKFDEKLRFLSTAHTALRVNAAFHSCSDLKRLLLRCLKKAVDTSTPQSVVHASVQTAKETPEIFLGGELCSFRRDVVVELFKMDVNLLLKNDAALLKETFARVNAPCNIDTLLGDIAHTLVAKIVNECTSVVAYSLLEVAKDLEDEAPLLFLIVKDVFAIKLDHLNPKSLQDFIHLGVRSLERLVAGLKLFRGKATVIDESYQKLQGKVNEWNDAFIAGSLGKSEMEFGLNASKKGFWDILAPFAQRDIPLITDIEAKINQWNGLQVELSNLFRGPYKGTLILEILMSYRCNPPSKSQLGHLLSDQVPQTSDYKDNVSLTVLAEHFRFAEKFMADNHEIVYVCEYFFMNESILFNNSFEMVSPKRSFTELADDILAAIDNLGHKIGPSSDFHHIRDTMRLLNGLETDIIQHELTVLLNCVPLHLQQDDIENFHTVGLLSNLENDLTRFISGCHQFKFEVTIDPSFSTAENMISDFFHHGQSQPVCNCISYAMELHNLFRPLHTVVTLSSLRASFVQLSVSIKVIACLSLNSEVWIFVRDMKWFGETGLRRFYEEYENITNVLVGSTASYEMAILDSLGPVVRIVSVLGSLIEERNLSSFLERLLLQEQTFDQLKQSSFDVGQIQKNVSLFREWFSSGLDEITGVSNAFNAIENTGTFSIRRAAHSDCIEYAQKLMMLSLRYDDENGSEQILLGDSLEVFVHQISLSHYESDRVAEVQLFLEQYQILVRTEQCLSEMESFGFKTEMTTNWECAVGKKYIDESRKLLLMATDFQSSSQNWKTQIRMKYHCSLLFCKGELNEMYRLVVEHKQNPSEHFVHELMLMLSRTVVDHKAGDYAQRLSVTNNVIVTAFQDLEEGITSWLEIISKCTLSFFLQCGNDLQIETKLSSKSHLMLHTLSCDTDAMPTATLRVLTDIYKTRLPYSFELLDAEICSGVDDLSVFLLRTKAYVKNVFVIFNVENLPGTLLETLLSFFSNQSHEMGGFQLHCIQRQGSFLHTSPWVRGQAWDNDSLKLNESHGPGNHWWRTFMIDGEGVQNVTVMTSECCGAGKTSTISMKLNESMERPNALAGVIMIHEGSTCSSLVEALRRTFLAGIGDRAVHFSLTTLPTETSKSLILLQMLNHFLFSLLVLKQVHCGSSRRTFHIGAGKWRVYVEFPSVELAKPGFYEDWIEKNIPILTLCSTFTQPTALLRIGNQGKRVCTYLRAYEDGTIDRKFEPSMKKQILFVLDKSGSMAAILDNGQTALSVATDNALRIFDTHIDVGDTFGVVMFDHQALVEITPQEVADESSKVRLRSLLDAVRQPTDMGGTNLYAGLSYAINAIKHNQTMESWIICLTDGCSADSPDLIRGTWSRTSVNAHLVVVGVNLLPSYESTMRMVCNKFEREPSTDSKGFFVRAEADYMSISNAFTAVSRCLPVSKTFELDGALSDDQCRVLVSRFIPKYIRKGDMLLQDAWIKFLFRRVTVFDQNDSFNFNETHDHLGSTLMETMLSEVDRFLSVNQNHDWIEQNHAQLIYDFSGKSPEFRLLCTAPDMLNAELKSRLESLDLPGFHIPLKDDLQNRETLHRYISQAMNIPLSSNSNGVQVLQCVEDSGFVLTLDFAVKILLIHERVECRLPVIIEGETGVSKTALTKMYSILRNAVHSPLHEHQTFYEVNIDSSLNEDDLITHFHQIRCAAQELLRLDITIVVFLDEINTSSIIGFLKGIIIDHSLAGNALEENIVIVSACNPSRKEATTQGQNTREIDLGREWASGHYQVCELPSSITMLKWWFASLNSNQEKEFIYQRLEILGHATLVSSVDRCTLTELIATSQQLIRCLAEKNIFCALKRRRDFRKGNEPDEILQQDARDRSRSVVSLRDIQRVFSFYEFFARTFQIKKHDEKYNRRYEAMVLAVMVVYYMRLDATSRQEFKDAISSIMPTSFLDGASIEDILLTTMNAIMKETEIPAGIALTQGLKENVFMILVCSLSGTPLMIVGPPGSSKTLSVNVMSNNANGEDSPSPFYRQYARISLYHYQCSRQSTSKEILDVFNKATQRQSKCDNAKQKCVVFMDEAGLPEEEKESLKVLHFLLEGHMSTKAQVGFIAITNHVLDAAKSNRCVMLLRQEPDTTEMMTMTRGVLFGLEAFSRVDQVEVDTQNFTTELFALSLCNAYEKLIHHINLCASFSTFFGLRDFIYLLKAIRLESEWTFGRMTLSIQALVSCIERNFNGVSRCDLHRIVCCFFKSVGIEVTSKLAMLLRHPMDVIADAVSTSKISTDVANRPRFKLIIDCTEDDSILRLLGTANIIDLKRKALFKLSHRPEQAEMEKLRLISGVKFAALQGNLAILSQIDSVQESFYDLFNQHFRVVSGRDGTPLLYANIAVGGISRRCLVKPDFECIVHVRQSKMTEMPAPFLNRFEKFSITIHDVLEYGLKSMGRELASGFERARLRTIELASLFGRDGIFGYVADHTIDSIFADMLPKGTTHLAGRSTDSEVTSLTFAVIKFVRETTSLIISTTDVQAVIEIAGKTLDDDSCNILNHILDDHTSQPFEYALHELNTMDETFVCQPLHRLLSILFEMIVTRSAMLRLLQLATPEAVFSRRNELPSALILEYFQQEHFSLKRLLIRLELRDNQHLKSSLTMVYTRTDANIHRLPSVGPDGVHADDRYSLDLCRRFVHDNLNQYIILHLTNVPTEASLRILLETWVQNKTKSMCLMLVDMNQNESLESTNYVRILVEQLLIGVQNKSFILLLHYPPSSVQRLSWYPALFLGGWDHFFLDNIGATGGFIDPERLIQVACQNDDAHEAKSQVALIVASLLPQILPHVTSQRLLYPRQEGQGRSFEARKARVHRLMSTDVGEATVSQILIEKFAKMWSTQELLKTVQRASVGLLQGATQLSLCMSIISVLMESFDAYLSIALTATNEWLNLDIVLTKNGQHKGGLKLFGMILEGMPSSPIEELNFARQVGTALPLLPFEPNRKLSNIRFPFFYFMSTFFDELTTNILIDMSLESKIDKGTTPTLEPNNVLEKLMTHFQQSANVTGSHGRQAIESQRSKVVKDAIEFVASQPYGLTDDYLKQFIEWKVGCPCNTVILSWFENQLRELNKFPSIVAIHVVSKLYELELVKVAAFADFIHSHTPLSPSDVNCKYNLTTQNEMVLFMLLLEYFENYPLNLSTKNNQAWTRDFTQCLVQLPTLLRQSDVQHIQLKRLRLLVFSHIHTRTHAFSEIVRFTDPDLLSFVANHKVETGDLALQFLLSTQWLTITELFVQEDFSCLINLVKDGSASSSRRGYFCLLVQYACKTYPSFTKNNGGLSTAALSIINSELCTNSEIISEFFGDGDSRVHVPHFIPAWLSGTTTSESVSRREPDIFFTGYHHNYGTCPLAAAVFELILQNTIQKALLVSSQDLFLRLQIDMEIETNLTRKDYIRLQRLRNLQDTSMTLTGTKLSAMCLDAQLLCFVAKVAWEFATQGTSLTGTYRNDCISILEKIMTLPGCRWSEFFFRSIINIRGEGTLMSLLADGGPLRPLKFCEAYELGSTPLRIESEQILRDAERALADAEEEEEKKASEFRLCPNCSQPFIIAELNCGQFTCGQDFHGRNGQNGCGKAFNVNTAAYYNVNQITLAPFLNAVASARDVFIASQRSGELWDAARNFDIPVMVVQSIADTGGSSFLPSYFAFSSDTFFESNLLIRQLVEGPEISLQISLLPDLIEFYLWLHMHFRYLVSKEHAFEIMMKELMRQDLLLKRFDRTFTKHIMQVWTRVVKGFDYMIQADNGRVPWKCSFIEYPFQSLLDATFVSLLSEGNDPSDGNDFLFLAIQHIINEYNDLTRKMLDLYNGSEGQSTPNLSVYPRFLSTACGSVPTLNGCLQLNKTEIDLFVQTAWDPESREIKMKAFHDKLREHIQFHSAPPFIANPLLFLRQKFTFRDDDKKPAKVHVAGVYVLKGSFDDYFANLQDYHLFTDVVSMLDVFSTSKMEGDLGRLLNDNFHTFCYEGLRQVLNGMRTFVQLMHAEGGLLNFKTFHEAIVMLKVSSLEELGFPLEYKEQEKLTSSFTAIQLLELVKYIGRQLASEGYVFRALPLCMTDPVSKWLSDLIVQRLDLFMEEYGPCRAHAALDSFVQDVLSYYERMIRDVAFDSNKNLAIFLMTSNCCDKSDPIFALLPEELSVRNYVSLRQLLHQIKLRWLYNEVQPKGDQALPALTGTAFKQISRGHCWLWTRDSQIEDTDNLLVKQTMLVESESELWFMPTTDTSEPVNEGTASIIQRWWRRRPREIESVDLDKEGYVEIIKCDLNLFSNYGSRDNEMHLRKWLNNYKIHQSVGEYLIELGARDIGDVKTFVTSGYHLTELVSVSFFDLRKLEKAVKELTDENASTVGDVDADSVSLAD